MTPLADIYDSIQPRYPEFAGKVALVTGSSMSIGKGIACRLAREGMRIVIHGKDPDEVTTTVQELQSLGADVDGVSTDFSDEHGVTRLFDKIRGLHDSLFLLVNNAADLRRTHFHDASAELLDYQLQVNLRAPYMCAIEAVPLMRRNRTGAIINISSVGGQRAHWRGLPYDLTKGALNSMTQAMALELARDGIRVNAVAPGAVRNTQTPPANHQSVRQRSGRIPLGRIGTALEVGAAVAFLASEDASYITGHVLCVDGGLSAQLSPKEQPI